ncbi:MAG TPA: sigma-70 family RNA polymerase sigma factor [Pseudonocardiaceae bacterium]|nr:sigma-70 family RNA polymerase sigma factor [Pseudonocardiaceae bacterium]
MEELTDLVRAASAGDEAAWNQLVTRYLPLVKSVIRSLGLAGQDAEDVAQIVWLRLVEHLNDIREPRALAGWLKTTTRNECLHVLKSTRRTVPVGTQVEPGAAEPDGHEVDEDLLLAERHQALLAALAELPEHQRNLLVLLAADPPLPYAEIASRLGMRIGSIGPTRARALSRLRQSPAVAALLEESTEVPR